MTSPTRFDGVGNSAGDWRTGAKLMMSASGNSLTGAAGATVEVSLNGSIRNGDSSDPIDNAGVIVLNDDLNHPGLSGTLKGGGQVVLTDGTDGAIITKGMLPRRPGGNRA